MSAIAEVSVTDYVKALVADAPPLTVEQCAIIRSNLGPLPGQGYAGDQARRDRELLIAEERRRNLKRSGIERAQADLDRAQSKFQDALTACRGCDIPLAKHHFANPAGSSTSHDYEPMTPMQVSRVAASWAKEIAAKEAALAEAVAA